MEQVADEPYCLVLGGGGAKGVYHAGVWRALQELRVPITACVGNSVGALLGALLAQGDGDKLEAVTDSIKLSTVLDVPPELLVDGKLSFRKARLPFFRVFTRDILRHRGISTAPLRKLLETHIDEEKLRASNCDFGIQTFNVSDMRSGGKFIDEIPSGKLIEYLLASSAVPGFVAPIIEGKKFVDGGVHDNVPFSMARRRGYRKIIAVDIDGAGITRRPDIRGAETVYIKCSIPLGGILDFEKETLADLKQLGYLDAMKAFGRIGGYHYAIDYDRRTEERFLSWLSSGEGAKLLSEFISSHGLVDTASPYDIRQVFPRDMRYERNLLLVLIECAAHLLEVPKIARYSYQEIIAEILERKASLDARIVEYFGSDGSSISARMSRGIESIIKGAIGKDELVDPPYYYLKILDLVLREKAKNVLRARVSGLLPHTSAGELFFEVANRFSF